MKQKPEYLYKGNIARGYLLYGNNPAIEKYLSELLLPIRFGVTSSQIETLTESDVLQVSKTALYLNTSLFNPKKLILIKEATDKILSVIESYRGSVPIVLVGKNLRANSKLVQIFQSHGSYIAVAIYSADFVFLRSFFEHELSNRTLDSECLQQLIDKTASFQDAQLLVSQLKQLCPSGECISWEQIQLLEVSQFSSEIFEVANVIVSKNAKAILTVFQKSGEVLEKEIIPLLRIIAKQIWELSELCRKISKGVSLTQAVKLATPKIPFPKQAQVIHNLSKWSIKGLLEAVIILDKVELLCKQQKLLNRPEIERYLLSLCKI